MQVNDLNLLKDFKLTPAYKALQALLLEVENGIVSDLKKANEVTTFRQCQGGIATVNYISKMLEDIDLLRSLQDNPNVEPEIDKEP